ncbi:homeobox domain protein [Teladorsagia circumcincta]|uniref:Homeobox domain protein n=1 Tax=Teladorsagia circumcincta TaxID=45464 RepID=A0A2G9TZJ6_TELCI|nr:homeobox domain protein [Teladorsagia circumcincta]
MLEMAQPVLFVPPDLVELLIYRVDTYVAMDWADALALSMEVDSSVAIVSKGLVPTLLSLTCAECCRPLDESCTAFVRNSVTYCREDYYRLFGTKCSRCDLPFDRSELVMRARHAVYHVACFSCVACERQLKTGDEFQIKGNSLYCRADCEAGNVPEPSSIPTPSMFANDDSWETSTMTSLDHTTSPPLSVRSPKSDDMGTPQNNGFHNTSGSSAGSSGKKKKDKQTTRVRTVLNEHQLSILKKCYALNSRPDALLKEQLVEMTALNARVIRVWFQNKRCKDKKRQIQMRDMAVNAEKCTTEEETPAEDR